MEQVTKLENLVIVQKFPVDEIPYVSACFGGTSTKKYFEILKDVYKRKGILGALKFDLNVTLTRLERFYFG